MGDMSNPVTNEEELARMREENNPNNEPTGHYTGRCHRCGSNDLWDDYLAYGCNSCGALLNGGDVPNDPETGLPGPRIIQTS
jgi:uncharacterized protein (DUF983 family)